MKNNDTDNKQHLFDNPKNVKILLGVFYALCVILFVADFFVHRHIYTHWEEIPTFYALYGFVACVVLVLIAKVMRVVLMRDEDYYDKPENETEKDGEKL